MKRAIIIFLVVALLAGMGFIGFSSQASAAKIKIDKSEQPTRLIEIFTDEPLDPTQTPVSSRWFDVSEYRKFKLLVRMTPAPPLEPPNAPPPWSAPPPPVVVNVQDNPAPPEPGGNPGAYVNIPMNNYGWSYYPKPDFDARWAMSPTFEGLYSNIQISAMDSSGLEKPPEEQYRISLYLLMAKE